MHRRRSSLRSVLALGAPLVFVFSGCGARTLLDPFDLAPRDGDDSSSGGSRPTGGVPATGGSSPLGGGPSSGGRGGTSGSSGRGGSAGRGGVSGGGFGGSGGTGPTGGNAGEGADGGLGGAGGEGGEGGMRPIIAGLALGAFHTCVRYDDGDLRCWGSGGYTGSGDRETIGDDETPDTVTPVEIGGHVIGISAGWYDTCALLDSLRLRCFGGGRSGALGYGNTFDIGDDELPEFAGDVSVGGNVQSVAAGPNHTCAALVNGTVRCWGQNSDSQLGYPSSEAIGDNELPSAAGPVDVGGPVAQLAVGLGHTCALLRNGRVRCWGSGNSGVLGYGNQNRIGDDEPPASAGDVDLGAGRVTKLVAAQLHTCALFDSGAVRCWGSGLNGVLGHASIAPIGDDETPASAGDVPVGDAAIDLATGDYAVCALLESGRLRCWGSGDHGELGYGNTRTIGDDETPASAGDVPVGGPVSDVAVGFLHVCATLSNGDLRCWGRGSTGALGYGNTRDVGDDETPSSVGNVHHLPPP